MSRFLWLLQFLIVIFLTLPLALLPLSLALKVGERLGDLLHFFWRSRRKIAEQNLSSAVARNAIILQTPPVEVIRQNFRNLGRSFVEIVKLYYGLGDDIVRNVTIEGGDHFTRAYEKGRGVILISGHCGNWELNAITLSLKVKSGSAVARPVNNPYLNRLVERAREKYGNRIIYKQGALKQILSTLKRNEPVGILMDQSVISPEGVMADFLGKKDYIMKTPALIAMKTGAPVLPVFITRVDGGHRIEIGKEIELDRSEDIDRALFNNSVRFSGCIEEYIRRNPSEWLWIHRRWKRVKE